MCNSRCHCSSGCGNASPCNRHGERILVNQAGCNSNARSRCSCANTYRPGHGCHEHGDVCHRPCPPRPCPPRPCPPRPCPPQPCPPKPCRPDCEENCRAQYHRCMRNCRRRRDFEVDRFDDETYEYDNQEDYRENDYDYERGFEE